MDRNIDDDGTFSASPGHDRGEESGPLELAYLNLVRLKPGTVVNERYRLEKLIGQGGFGIVFAALDVTLQRMGGDQVPQPGADRQREEISARPARDQPVAQDQR